MSPSEIDSIEVPPPGRGIEIPAGVAGYRATFTTVEAFPGADGSARLELSIGGQRAELQLGPDEAKHLARRIWPEPASVPEDVQ